MKDKRWRFKSFLRIHILSHIHETPHQILVTRVFANLIKTNYSTNIAWAKLVGVLFWAKLFFSKQHLPHFPENTPKIGCWVVISPVSAEERLYLKETYDQFLWGRIILLFAGIHWTRGFSRQWSREQWLFVTFQTVILMQILRAILKPRGNERMTRCSDEEQ